MHPMSRRHFLTSACSVGAGLMGHNAFGSTGLNLKIGAILPLGGEGAQITAAGLHDVAATAQKGLLMGIEETQKNAELFGHQINLLLSNAPSVASVKRAARRLIEYDGVSVLIGGFNAADAAILSDVAQETGTLFLNIAATADHLRTHCSLQTFHIESSAAMYLDAVAGWFVRAGHRKWFVVSQNDTEGHDRFARMQTALADRHWGGKIVGHASIDPEGRDFEPALKAIRASKPDVVLVLTDWISQLRFAARYDAAGLSIPITGFP